MYLPLGHTVFLQDFQVEVYEPWYLHSGETCKSWWQQRKDKMAHLQHLHQHKFQLAANHHFYYIKTCNILHRLWTLNHYHTQRKDSYTWWGTLLQLLGSSFSSFILPVLCPANDFPCNFNILENSDSDTKLLLFKIKSAKLQKLWEKFTI